MYIYSEFWRLEVQGQHWFCWRALSRNLFHASPWVSGLITILGIPWLTQASPCLCVHVYVGFSQCVLICVHISPFHLGLGVPPNCNMTYFLTSHTYNDLISKFGHILRYYLLGHQHMNLRGGGTTQPITVSAAVSLSSSRLTLHNTGRSLNLYHLPQCLLAPIKCLLRQ